MKRHPSRCAFVSAKVSNSFWSFTCASLSSTKYRIRNSRMFDMLFCRNKFVSVVKWNMSFNQSTSLPNFEAFFSYIYLLLASNINSLIETGKKCRCMLFFACPKSWIELKKRVFTSHRYGDIKTKLFWKTQVFYKWHKCPKFWRGRGTISSFTPYYICVVTFTPITDNLISKNILENSKNKTNHSHCVDIKQQIIYNFQS